MLGYTHTCPIACWDTHTPAPLHAGIHTFLPQCMLGYTHTCPIACWDTPPAPLHAGLHPPPSVNRMTDRCKNISLPPQIDQFPLQKALITRNTCEIQIPCFNYSDKPRTWYDTQVQHSKLNTNVPPKCNVTCNGFHLINNRWNNTTRTTMFQSNSAIHKAAGLPAADRNSLERLLSHSQLKGFSLSHRNCTRQSREWHCRQLCESCWKR